MNTSCGIIISVFFGIHYVLETKNLDSVSTQVRAMSGLNPRDILDKSKVLVRKIQHYLKLLLKQLCGALFSNISTAKILIRREFRGVIASNPVTTDKYFAKY